MTDRTGPTLTDAKGMGGVNAQDGFDYQVWDAVVRLPGWIRSPAFEGLTIEGLEDVEARFFAPHARHGHLLDRFQAKSADLTHGQVVDVFRGFKEFDDVHPGSARAHILVTPSLPNKLQWLGKDTERVRRARPFYAPFSSVIAASDGKLATDIVKEFGTELGPSVAQSFDVDLRVVPNRATAEALFAAELERAFPHEDFTRRSVAAAFHRLAEHLGRHRGEMVERSTVLRLLQAELGKSLTAEPSLPVHVRSDRNAPAEHAIEIDASPFSGTAPLPPSPAEWQALLLEPLERTARWAHRNDRSRIRVTGSYRLSTAFAVGWAFRAATGFELEICTREGDWLTDDRPGLDDPEVPWEINAPPHLRGERLVVSIGVLRDPAAAVGAMLGQTTEAGMLRAYLGEPIAGSRAAQASVQAIKSAVTSAVARLSPSGIDLYFAGPAALAVAIGHRWNAMPATQLHEFRPGEGYSRSAILR